MYVLSPSQIPYAYFPDAFIYVPSLIENLIFEVIILIDVCHFDQAVAQTSTDALLEQFSC